MTMLSLTQGAERVGDEVIDVGLQYADEIPPRKRDRSSFKESSTDEERENSTHFNKKTLTMDLDKDV